MRALTAPLLLSLCLFARAGEAAEPAHVRLLYSGGATADGCLDEEGLRRAFTERAGYDPILATASDAIAVSVTHAGDRVVARVDLVGPDGVILGSRVLDARAGDCGELLQAVALSVGIALDRIEHETAPPPEAKPPPPPVETKAPPPDDTTTHDAQPPVTSSGALAIDLAAGMSAWLGAAPATSFAPTVRASVRSGRFEAGVEGRLQLPSSASEQLAAGEVRTSLVGAGPQACFDARPFFACAVTFVGWLSATAPGVASTGTKQGIDLLAGARGGVALPIGAGFSLRASLDLLATLYGPTVRIAGQDVWHPSPVAGGAQLAIAWTIP